MKEDMRCGRACFTARVKVLPNWRELKGYVESMRFMQGRTFIFIKEGRWATCVGREIIDGQVCDQPPSPATWWDFDPNWLEDWTPLDEEDF